MIIELNNTNKSHFITVAPDMILSFISIPYIRALGDYYQDENGKIYARGIIVFSLFYNSPSIIWHFVDEAYRDQGIGDLLLEEVLNNYPAPASFLFFSKYVNDNYFEQIRGYYEDYGFHKQVNSNSSIPDFIFLSESINAYPSLQKASIDNVYPLSFFSRKDIFSVLEALLPDGIMAFGPLKADPLDNELSCATAKNGVITSALFAGDYDNGITVFAMINFDANSPANTLKLLHFFMLEVNKRYPAGCRINIISSQSREKQADAFRRIFPQAREYVPNVMIVDSTSQNLASH